MTIKKIVVVLAALVVVIHIKISTSKNIKLTGLFEVRPSNGYVWNDTYDKNSRFYFNDIKVLRWREGMIKPLYNVQASAIEGVWEPLPGYEIIGAPEKLFTLWKPGSVHPKFKAWAGQIEGKWVPMLGYRFILSDGGWTDVVWEPGQKNDYLKITATQIKDQFMAFPGYTFVDPSKNLKVQWTPGMEYPSNHNYISSLYEGQWEEKKEINEPSNDFQNENNYTKGHGWNALASLLTAVIAHDIFDDEEAAKRYIIEGCVEAAKGISNNIKESKLF